MFILNLSDSNDFYLSSCLEQVTTDEATPAETTTEVTTAPTEGPSTDRPPLNNLPSPVIDATQSFVLNETSILIVWSAVENATSYTLVVDRVDGGRIVRISVSWHSFFCNVMTIAGGSGQGRVCVGVGVLGGGAS